MIESTTSGLPLRRSNLIAFIFAVLVLILAGMDQSARAADPSEDALWQMLVDGEAVALLRHASAPGFGDPDHFELGDCSTQRNLSQAGREQARHIGDRFRRHGITHAVVRSSQWCRTLDTARLLDLGDVAPTPALNSFFGGRSTKASQTQKARNLILDNHDGRPRIFVTHQVNISALTGGGASSGEMVIVKPMDGTLQTVGRIAAPE